MTACEEIPCTSFLSQINEENFKTGCVKHVKRQTPCVEFIGSAADEVKGHTTKEIPKKGSISVGGQEKSKTPTSQRDLR